MLDTSARPFLNSRAERCRSHFAFMSRNSADVVTLTPNPAIDRTVFVARFAPGSVHRAEGSRCTPGGKGVNVASALADAGLRVAATGFLGRENRGLFEQLFAQKQIADDFVRIEGETRTGIKIVDSATRQTTEINLPGATPDARSLDALMERIAAWDARWFVLAGSLPPGIPPGFYRDLVGRLKSRGICVAVDASDEPLRLAIEAAPTVVKPNIHELEALVGSPLATVAEVIEAARGLIARGIRLVVVSMGGEGACFVSHEQVVAARPPAIAVGSTVGAGDAMVAGIVYAQMRNLALEDCARMATAFSLAALARNADPSGVAADVTSLQRQVALSFP